MTESPTQQATGLDIWTWSSNPAAPTAGQYETDSHAWTGGTKLSISNQDSAGNNATTKLSSLQVGATIRAEFDTDPNSFHEWTVTGSPITQASYFDVPVTDGASGGSTPSNNQSCKLTFTGAPTPPDPTPGAEPMYGPEDVARAVHTSGKRALASAYYSAMGIQWLNYTDAQALVQAIDSGQPLAGVPESEALLGQQAHAPQQASAQQATAQSEQTANQPEPATSQSEPAAAAPSEPTQGGSA
jgi:hypothetical protein